MNAKVNISNRAGASFPVRRMDFEFGDVPRYWANGDAALTHFMTALSALFPEGEQFFVNSTRAVRNDPKLADPRLQKEISAFIGQEAMHSKEHLAFNASAQAYGYDVRKMEEQTGKVINYGVNVITTLLKPFGFNKEMIGLTGTCALEHFTSTIAEELLSNPDIQSMFMDETMYHLWMWHAVEENDIAIDQRRFAVFSFPQIGDFALCITQKRHHIEIILRVFFTQQSAQKSLFLFVDIPA